MRLLFTLFLAILLPTVAQAATFTVDTAGDAPPGACAPGSCTLRNAILAANTAPGADTIAFNVPPTSGSDVALVPTSALPPVTGNDTTINGYTQSGAVPPTDDPVVFNGTIRVLLDGRLLADSNASGLRIAGNRIIVRGLAIVGFAHAQIEVTGSSNVVAANRIGTDLANVVAEPLPRHGVVLRSAGTAPISNLIGTFNERNLISGVALGVLADGIGAGQNLSEENRISNNHINIGANGIDYAFGGHGVEVRNSTNVRVGASQNSPFPPGNLIGGSPIPDRIGVLVRGGTRIFVEENTIGGAGFPSPAVYPVGTGILLRDGASFCFVQDNFIVATRRNGIELIDGTAPVGSTRATITGNSVLSPGGLAIDLGADGLDANDPLDADIGPNFRQNAPTITNVVAQSGNYRVTIAHSGEPNTDYSFDLFAVPAPPSGGPPLADAKNNNPFAADAMTYIFGSIVPNVVRTDANGTGTATGTVLRQRVPPGSLIAATATKNVFSGTPTTSERGRASSFAALPAGSQILLQFAYFRLDNISEARLGRIVRVYRTGNLSGAASVTVVRGVTSEVTPPPGGNFNPSWASGDGSARDYRVAYIGPTPPAFQRIGFGMHIENPVGASLGLPSVYTAEVGATISVDGVPVYDVVFADDFG